MSWDLYVQDWGMFESLEQISDDFEPQPIGKRSELINKIKKAEPRADFSNSSWGILEDVLFSIEFNMGESDIVEGFVMHVRGKEHAMSTIEKSMSTIEKILGHLNLKATDGSTSELLNFTLE